MVVEKIFFALSLIEILHILSLSLSLVMKAFFMVIRARPFLSAFNKNLSLSLSPRRSLNRIYQMVGHH